MMLLRCILVTLFLNLDLCIFSTENAWLHTFYVFSAPSESVPVSQSSITLGSGTPFREAPEVQRVTVPPTPMSRTSLFSSLKHFDIACKSTASSLSRQSPERVTAMHNLYTNHRSDKELGNRSESNSTSQSASAKTLNETRSGQKNQSDSAELSSDDEEYPRTSAIELNKALKKLSRQVEEEVAKCVEQGTPPINQQKDGCMCVSDMNNGDSYSSNDLCIDTDVSNSDLSTRETSFTSPLHRREKDIVKYTNPERGCNEKGGKCADVNKRDLDSGKVYKGDLFEGESVVKKSSSCSLESLSSVGQPPVTTIRKSTPITSASISGGAKRKYASTSSEEQFSEPSPEKMLTQTNAKKRESAHVKEPKCKRRRSQSPRSARHYKSRSSNRSRSRSPYRGSRLPYRYRSPYRSRSRSPYRARYRSPNRSRSRSPGRSISRSPTHRRARSPTRVGQTKRHILDELVQKADEKK